MKPIQENMGQYISVRETGFHSEIKGAIEYMMTVLNQNLKPTGRKPASVNTVRVCRELRIQHEWAVPGSALYEVFYNESRNIVKSLREKLTDVSSIDNIEIVYQEDMSNTFGMGRIVVVVEATRCSWSSVVAVSSAPEKKPEPVVTYQPTGERDL